MHVVTLLEEMPVQETVDAVAELRELGMPVGAVVINQARAREDLHALGAFGGLDASKNSDPTAAAELNADLEAVGLDLPPATVEGLLDEVHRHTERVALEVEQLTVLEQLGHGVDGLLHGHLLQEGDHVHAGRVGVQQLGDRALSLIHISEPTRPY